MNLLSEEIKESLISSGYKVANKILLEKIATLERRISQLEAALDLYRKGASRGNTDEETKLG